MNRQREAEHNLIGHILSALYISEQNSGHEKASSLSDNDFLQTALELRAFMNEMPGGFFIYRADGNEDILYANNAMLRLFNCDTIEEFRTLTGNSFRGIVHPEDLEAVENSIREQIAENQYDLDYVEYRIIQKDGQIRWVEDYGHFVHSELTGDIFYVFAGDATEKRKKQTEEQQQRLEIIEGLSCNYETILYIDLNTDKLLPYRLSSRTMQQFDLEGSLSSYLQFCSDYINTWVYPEDRELITQALDPPRIQRKLASSKTYYVNYRAVEQNELLYLQLRIVDVGNQVSPSRIVLGFRRVDDEIRFEMEQKKLYEDALNQANLANIAKNTFLANMSHDIRTPLNAITGFITLAKNHMREPEKLTEYINKIHSSSEQLLSLINDILEISRMESGTFQTEETACYLPDLIKEVQSSLLPQAEKKQLTLLVDFSRLQHPYAYSDPEKLKQILLCLGSNAVKYTQNGGQVRIAILEEKAPSNNYASYQFRIEDNGIGIEPEYLERIFEPFERVRNTTFSGFHGTGLGLTIVKRLAEIMDGTVEAESTPGKGSRFTVSFNLRIQTQNSFQPEDVEKLVVSRMAGRKILLVDDNGLNLELESELLEDLGFLVETAEDGQVAIKLLQADPESYGLVLMDIQMPVMNGYETAQIIRSQTDPRLCGIPIIAVSANSFDEDRRRSRKSGMNAHLPKPLNVDHLLELMVNMIS